MLNAWRIKHGATVDSRRSVTGEIIAPGWILPTGIGVTWALVLDTASGFLAEGKVPGISGGDDIVAERRSMLLLRRTS